MFHDDIDDDALYFSTDDEDCLSADENDTPANYFALND